MIDGIGGFECRIGQTDILAAMTRIHLRAAFRYGATKEELMEVFELVATFLFVVVVLGATQAGTPAMIAGLAIGLTLTVIHIVGIQVTGVSVIPARSLGPAFFAGAKAMGQLWLFIVAPLIGAGLAGLVFRTRLLSAA